jgi:hypothetical protein
MRAEERIELGGFEEAAGRGAEKDAVEARAARQRREGIARVGGHGAAVERRRERQRVKGIDDGDECVDDGGEGQRQRQQEAAEAAPPRGIRTGNR